MTSLADWKKVSRGKAEPPPNPIETVGDTLPVSHEPTDEERYKDWPPITEVDKTIDLFCLTLAAGKTPMEALIMSGDKHQVPYRASWLLRQPVVIAELQCYAKPLLLLPELAKVWASRQLESIADSSITDFLFSRNEREYARADDGTLILDDKARPVYTLTQRMVLNPDLMSMSRRQLQAIRKIKVKRRPEGDEIELEMYDRHKAIMDLATLAGLRPQPTPVSGDNNEKQVYDDYSEQLAAAEEQHAARMARLRKTTHEQPRLASPRDIRNGNET